MSKKSETKQVVVKSAISQDAIAKLMLHGDLSVLTPIQKVEYYGAFCGTLGLNALSKPFDYIKMNGKEVLYANKGCAEQLRGIFHVSIKIHSREMIEGVYVVTADAETPDGRTDSATGCVYTKGVVGGDLANAYMKAETKAKRRVTLSICGLNMLDETEIDSVPGAARSDKNGPIEPKTVESTPVGSGPKPEPKTEAKAKTELTPAELSQKVLEYSETLKMNKTQLRDFIQSVTGKATPKDLTFGEMSRISEMLQHEIGRM